MTWFERLTGCGETSPEQVRRDLAVVNDRLVSRVNGASWLVGRLETPTLAELRKQAHEVVATPSPLQVREVVANVQHLHVEDSNEHALFQVASQFNLLEMTSPGVTPECGVGIYEDDYTQGPACAIAAGAGTIYRNYFVEHDGHVGQSETCQINCLSEVGKQFGDTFDQGWKMVNGYALPSRLGLEDIDTQLKDMDESARDRVRQALKIGVQWDTQVTLVGASHTVSQAYCSAMPVAYTRYSSSLWESFATLILEAAYEATMIAAILNARRTGCKLLYLTLLGGGAFGNDLAWILRAIRRSFELYIDCGLDIAIVSYGASNAGVRRLVSEFA